MALSSGCTAFLSKPIRKASLLAALAKHVPNTPLPRVPFPPDPSGLPSEVQELVPGYLKQKRVDLDKLWTAIDAADYATVSTLGHQLKGSGSSYGFDDISTIGSALERAALSHDAGETYRQAALLAGSFSRIWALSSSN